MSNPDRAELQRIAQQVEAKRERLQNLETQVTRLEEVSQEHASAIIADIPSEAGAVVDIGSGIQAEKTREEVLEILSARNQELLSLMDSLKSEFDETEKLVIELATQFNDGVAELQDELPEATEATSSEESESRPKRRRRKRGTAFTLDD